MPVCNNKRKVDAIVFANDTKERLFKFMDDCQKHTNYYVNIKTEKEFYASLIDDVMLVFKKEYKRILFVIDNLTDIELMDNEQEYLFNAEKLENAFSVINMMTNEYDEMIY